MLLLENDPLCFEARQVVEGEHVAQAWERAALLLDLGDLGGVLAEHADRLRVVEDVRNVLR